MKLETNAEVDQTGKTHNH